MNGLKTEIFYIRQCRLNDGQCSDWVISRNIICQGIQNIRCDDTVEKLSVPVRRKC